MKMIKIGDLHITIAAYDEPLAITDFVCHLVGEERTSNVNITITPDNQVKIRYKPEKKEDRLDMMLKTAPESVQQALEDFKSTANRFVEYTTYYKQPRGKKSGDKND